MELLYDGVCYVVFTFSDGTKQTLHTTMNKEILRKSGAVLRPDFLYDLDRMRYVAIRTDATDISVFGEKPQESEEVLSFANRFI